MLKIPNMADRYSLATGRDNPNPSRPPFVKNMLKFEGGVNQNKSPNHHKGDETMSRIHVCLVSAQPIPNLIPLKMEALKPDKVVLLVSDDMKVQAERLKHVTKDWGITVEVYPISPFDLESARETCLNLLTELENEEVVLNFTGGTKVMALAAVDVFKAIEKPMLYVDTQNRKILYFAPGLQHIEFKSVIKVKPYLAAYGQEIVEDDTAKTRTDNHRALIESLVNRINHFEKVIGTMNYYSARARDSKQFPHKEKIEKEKLSWPLFMELVKLFEDNGIVSLQGEYICYGTEDDAKLASGGWFEEYVFRTVSSLHPTDLHTGVKVSSNNEYDVVFTNNNQLYLIECKTKKFDSEDDARNADPIYKLDSLKDAAGGIYGKGMFVSYKRWFFRI